ncbi:MAG TPA: SRPBCC family protein [Gemmatimonadaceae bacterium]
MKWLLVIVAVIAVAVLIVVAIGYSLPVSHTATRAADVSVPPDKVWAIISDPVNYPAWRPDVTKVEQQPGTPLRWVEFSGGDRISYEAQAFEPPSHFTARITDKGLPFGGNWDYHIEPAGTGSRITITENGEVYNPIFRFVSRFVMGHTATLDKYLTALATRTGDTYDPGRRN